MQSPQHATLSLPEPSGDAKLSSARLCDKIAAEIRAETPGDGISFARYMELALYTPGLGYYSGGLCKFGPQGDFVTSPEITPLFGQALSNQIAQVMRQSAAQILEVGAGTGLLAADILLALETQSALPRRYAILELSGELRERQRQTLQEKTPHLLARVEWLNELPARFEGCVVANEVLDVMPVHLVAWRPDGIFERGVGLTASGELAWVDRPLPPYLHQAVVKLPIESPQSGEYVSEICPAAQAWTAQWAQRLERGAIVLIDYGYARQEYYLPHRSTGTLLCYYQHRAHADPFRWPGLCDITAFVDFTAIADAAFEAALDVVGYTTQAQFLINCGLLEHLAQRGDTQSANYIRAARAAHRLTAPQEMGELFKVLALGRKLDEPLIGFRRGDRLHTL